MELRGANATAKTSLQKVIGKHHQSDPFEHNPAIRTEIWGTSNCLNWVLQEEKQVEIVERKGLIFFFWIVSFITVSQVTLPKLKI